MKHKYTQPKPQTAEQINAQVGSIKVEAPPMREGVAAVGPIEFDPAVWYPINPGMEGADALAGFLNALRRIRDSKSFIDANNRTFREWCMNKFGEGFGRIIDDNL